MDALPIILIIVAVIGFIFANKAIMKYFQSLYRKTEKNPLSASYQVLSALLFTPWLLINAFPPILILVVAIGAFVAIIVKNLQFKKPGTIISCTLLHVVYGIFFFFRALLFLVILVINALHAGFGWFSHISYNPLKVVVAKDGDLKEKSGAPIEGDNVSPASDGFDTAIYDRQHRDEANKAAIREEETREANERAEAYAQSQGFASADEAEDYGVKTGRRYDD